MEQKTFIDISTGDSFPKTLVVRNHEGGLIWQIYHVQKQSEADRLAANAHGNGFFGSTLENYQPDYDETWPDWRETPGGLDIIS
jgi:hypothetical protein